MFDDMVKKKLKGLSLLKGLGDPEEKKIFDPESKQFKPESDGIFSITISVGNPGTKRKLSKLGRDIADEDPDDEEDDPLKKIFKGRMRREYE